MIALPARKPAALSSHHGRASCGLLLISAPTIVDNSE